MIAYIKGEVAAFGEGLVVLETGRIGYNIRITAQTVSMLPEIGKEVKIHTYLYVKEDMMNLFGFLTREDLEIFKLLITVNGIGPKGALNILDAISPDDLRFAVLSGDAKTISKAPGIGAKTAQRLIIELKDKLSLEEAFEQKLASAAGAAPDAAAGLASKGEAVEALTALGYSGTEALKAVNKAEITEDMDTEAILKAALKQMSLL